MLWLLCTVSEPAMTSDRKELAVIRASIGLDQITSISVRCLTDFRKPRAYTLPGMCATKGEQVKNK